MEKTMKIFGVGIILVALYFSGVTIHCMSDSDITTKSITIFWGLIVFSCQLMFLGAITTTCGFFPPKPKIKL